MLRTRTITKHLAGARAAALSTRCALSRAAAASRILAPPEPKRTVAMDRDLPDPFVRQKQNRWYFACYGLGVVVSCAVIFNFEKTQSPIITSCFFFMRRLAHVRSAIGDDIEYGLPFPWISGPLNTVKGDVDIAFDVKGSNGRGTVMLKASRALKSEPFKVHHFRLEMHNSGEVVDLTTDPAIEF